MKKYIIDEKDLKELLNCQNTLYALENGGVDNWEYYSESIGDYLEEADEKCIDDIVKSDLKYYEILEEK